MSDGVKGKKSMRQQTEPEGGSEAAGQVRKGLARKACRGFPLV